MTADANNPKLDEDKVIHKLSLVGIVGNVFLSAFKFFAGIIGNSSAMVSDAVHSLSDVFATKRTSITASLLRLPCTGFVATDSFRPNSYPTP